jgi:hypothetical protein
MPLNSLSLFLFILHLLTLSVVLSQEYCQLKQQWDVVMLPTPYDHDNRSYFQGTIEVSCPECDYITWSLEIKSNNILQDQRIEILSGGKNFKNGNDTNTISTLDDDDDGDDKYIDQITNYFDTTRGSLTSWSPHMSSELLCQNFAPLPIYPDSTKSHTIFSCLDQTIETDVFFSGHIRWDSKFYDYFYNYQPNTEKTPPKPLNVTHIDFHVTFKYSVDGKDCTLTDINTRTYPLSIGEDAGQVEYISIDEVQTGHFSLFASFQTSQAFNTIVFRPFGALASHFLKGTVCNVNGISTETVKDWGLLPDLDTESNFMPIYWKQIFQIPILRLKPREIPFVPYTTLHSDDETLVNDYLIPKYTSITLKCDFFHPSRFYSDELPFGLSIQTGYIPSDAPVRSGMYIYNFLKTTRSWFLPRLHVFSSVVKGVRNIKDFHPQAVYYSGLGYNDLENPSALGSSLSLAFNLSQQEGFMACSKDLFSQAYSNFLVLVELSDRWKIDSMRYSLLSTHDIFETPVIYATGYSKPLPKQQKNHHNNDWVDHHAIFNSIPFCDAIKRLNKTHHHLNPDATRPASLQVLLEFSAKAIQPLDRYQEDLGGRKREYETGLGSPWPFNVIVVLQQLSLDYLQRSSLSFQPTSLTWGSTYQLVPKNMAEYLGKKYDNLAIFSATMSEKTNGRFLIDDFMIKPLKESFSMFLFWFPSATYRFQALNDVLSTINPKECTICKIDLYGKNESGKNGNVCGDEKVPIGIVISQTKTIPYLLPYPSIQAGMVFVHKFEAGYGYYFSCQDVIEVQHFSTFQEGNGAINTEQLQKNQPNPYKNDKRGHIHLSLHAFPTNDDIEGILDQARKLDEDKGKEERKKLEVQKTSTNLNLAIEKIVNYHLVDYTSTAPISPLEYSVIADSPNTIPHYTQVKLIVHQRGVLVLLITLLVILATTLIIIGIGGGFYYWKKKESNARKSALMEYTTDFYGDSVQEYMS